MENDFRLTPEEDETLRLLGTLDPKPAKIDEHAIWFEAGVRRGKRVGHLWQALTAASLALAIGSFTWHAKSDLSVARQHEGTAPKVAQSFTLPPATAPSSKTLTAGYVRRLDLKQFNGWRSLAADQGSGVLSQPTIHPGDDALFQLSNQRIEPKDIPNTRS
jgi:hypothetical protein